MEKVTYVLSKVWDDEGVSPDLGESVFLAVLMEGLVNCL